ncbi:hypothetical protein PFLmoz3_04230 [Pseudomonas fluorescens]|uniref:Uncharacterized protein n=1 Tax=Pseudomonas fluorescens TaxID=294 RepID=A0A109LEM1_PSEFL|nr:hypothetical protein PFLmoz3_04230 [Pseudomonas fluorescens]
MRGPVATTTALARPLTTLVPMKQMFGKSSRLPWSAASVEADFCVTSPTETPDGFNT